MRHTSQQSDSPPSQAPSTFRPPDLNTAFGSSASSLLAGHLLRGAHAGLLSDSDLAALTALTSLNGRLKQPPSLPPQLPPPETVLTPPEKASCDRRALFCRGCQRFYTSSIYHSHVGISRQLGDESINQLSESASRLGLVLTAPLITDTGFIYVPVHPACGQRSVEMTGPRETEGTKACRRPSPPSPLDLRVATSTTTQDEDKTKEAVKAPEAPFNMILALLSSFLIQSSKRGTASGVPESLLSLLNNMTAITPSHNWMINPKQPLFNTTEALEGLLMQLNQPPLKPNSSSSASVSSASNEAAAAAAVASSTFAQHLAAVAAAEGTRSLEQQQQQQQPQRPYLCTNCQTRFQAYSTFKVGDAMAEIFAFRFSLSIDSLTKAVFL